MRDFLEIEREKKPSSLSLSVSLSLAATSIKTKKFRTFRCRLYRERKESETDGVELGETSDGRQKIQGNRETNDNSLISLDDFVLFHALAYAQKEFVASQQFFKNFV